MLMLVSLIRSFKRLEPYDGKLSSTVLRGRRKWQHFLCYPTLVLSIFTNPVFADSQLYIFISFSLEKEVLNSLFETSQEYNPVFVLRGLKDNSFKATSEYIQTLDLKSNPAIIIDPNLFREYEVTSVPTYVFEENKLSGNVTAKFALDKLTQKSE
jgi:type-F conjugative transfer system pilin assembly protein TrbC